MELKEKLPGKLRGPLLAVLGAALLALLWYADREVTSRLAAARADLARLEASVAVSSASLEDLRAMRDLKLKDLADHKKALMDRARSKKAVYETGVALQEEKRLLEKQLEIMTTYLQIKEETGKISLMRGDHSLKDFPFSFTPPKAFGGAANMPASARVVSKERFAHPERGKVQADDGKLTWEPPQVGKDPRSGGLGEYVLFTDGPLIVHGPPPNKTLHEAYPHICAGVTAYTAKRLFESTFIGTKIIYEAKKKTPAR
ncbi:MAG TPA: hypothetical protein DCZ92_06850 [Elusimicrobia bacterium]|nr:MAG: hypothetical protein A2016_05115 [Elusimicrobia bacterium GWF2_62_30]HBA60524.1 hypothetical protein [Elusimicrobiota bacterium]